MTNTKEQEIAGTRTPEDIMKDENRGRWLFWIYFSLIIVSVFVYLALHRGWLGDIERIPAVETRDNLLASITRAEIVISATEVDMEIVRAQLEELEKKITGILDTTKEQAEEQAAKIDKAFKDTKKEIKDQALKDQEKQLKEVKEELSELRTEVTKIPGIDEERVTTLINKIEKEIDEVKSNFGVLKVYLEDLKDEIAKGKIVGGYFWSTGWLKWLELFFWALFGTLFYALMVIQRELRLQGEFRKRTAGYISMTLRGPFVTLLLLFALSTIKLGAVKVDIDLAETPIYVWIFLAGVLGYFSRVAYRQLELIVKDIFPRAWASVRRPFDIVPRTANVAFGETLQFRLEPKQDVRWDIWPDNLGSIDSTGKYTAPKKPGEPAGAVVGAQVTVRATLKEEPSIVEMAKVTLYEKFEVKGDAEVGFTTEHVYKVQPEQEGGVTWSIEPQLGQITEEGKYKAPEEGETPKGKNEPIAKVGTEITIKATRKLEPKVSVTKKIKLVEGT